MCKTAKASRPVEEKEPVVTTPTVATVEEPVKEEVPVVKEEIKDEVVVKEEPKKVVEKEDILAKMNAIAEEVVFELNKSQLDESGLKKLDEIAALMKRDPELVVNIVGHTCNRGTAELNNLLSVRRATYVRNQLMKRGIKSQRIDRSKGVGSENAIFDNNSEQQRKNRTIRFESAK